MTLNDEGTSVSWVSGRHKDWATNGNSYSFPEFNNDGVTVKVTKEPSRQIRVEVRDEEDHPVVFTEPMPACDALCVAVRWENGSVDLFLNGNMVATKRL